MSEAGTGKTPSVAVMQGVLWNDYGVGTVWPQPVRLLRKNRREVLRFTNLSEDDVVILDGTKAQVEAKLKSGAKVFLCSFKRFALSWRLLPDYVKALHIDEIHMGMKTTSSRQSQAMIQAMRWGGFEWFIAMTGTLPDGPLSSVYPAIHVIEPRYYTDEKDFMRQHALLDWDGKVIGWQNHEKIQRIFGRHGIRRTFKAIHGDQEVVPVPQIVEMSAKQEEMYRRFEKDAILELEKFYLDGTQPGVGFIRARQLMEHPYRFPDLTEPGKFIDLTDGEMPGKEGLLDVMLEDHIALKKPIIIFSALRPQQHFIMEMLAAKPFFRAALINGDTSIKTSDEYDLGFQQGHYNALVCSPQCASIGFNWQFCGKRELDHMVMMCLDFRDATYLQQIQRAVRGPRTSPLRISILEYADSIDQRVAKIVWRKSVDANKVDPTRPILQLSAFEDTFE